MLGSLYGVLILTAAAVSQMPSAANGAESLIHVTVREERTGDETVYHYRLTNRSLREIRQFWIGFQPGGADFELREPPKGWKFGERVPASSTRSPVGWAVEVYTQEESENIRVDWGRGESGRPIRPGQSAEFSVLVAQPDDSYVTAHWTVVFASSATSSGRMERVSAR